MGFGVLEEPTEPDFQPKVFVTLELAMVEHWELSVASELILTDSLLARRLQAPLWQILPATTKPVLPSPFQV